MTAKITDTDRGLADVARRLAGHYRLRVGVLSDAPKDEVNGEESSASLLEVAAIHEFGAPAAGIPQRSFLRAGVDANVDAIKDAQVKLAGQIALGKVDGRTGMERLGAKIVGLLQAFISRGIQPALKQSTIDRKGSSKPLIATGQLRSSISYRVEETGTK